MYIYKHVYIKLKLKPVASIESPSNCENSCYRFLSPALLLPQTTNSEFPKRGVFFTPHPLKLVTMAGLEKNLLQRSLVLSPKKPIHH